MSAGLSVSPRRSRAFDRHSRESGNPETNNVILAKAGTSPPREIERESQSTDPFSLLWACRDRLRFSSFQRML